MIGNEWIRGTIRRDRGIGEDQGDSPADEGRGWDSRLLRRGLAATFAICMVVFSAIPMSIGLAGHSNKDYSLWYQVGVAIREGLEIYPDPAGGHLFPFMYPPSAAALLGWVSLLGKHGTTLLLILSHSAAWVGAIALSVWLAVVGTKREDGDGQKSGVWGHHPLLYVAPSLGIIALIHNTYLLGQPNLALLTLLLAAFACLRLGREAWAGGLVATAAAIKAFPILALGYFVYRRMWRASAATVLALAAWLLIVPLPFRTPAQAVRDLSVWSRGMVFTYNAHGIAQRPYRSFSYKNQSIMALAHRFFRDVPADGEKVLSAHAAKVRQERLEAGLPVPAVGSGAIDLHTMLTSKAGGPDMGLRLADAEPAMRRAWRVNVAAFDFRTVTAITLALMLGLSLFVVAVMPPRGARTARTDAIEFALITLLIVMFSPLSFNYAYVWLIYPMTVALHLVLTEPSRGRTRTLELAWIAAVFGIPCLAIPAPLYAQAYGNLFFPALLLVIGLGLKLHGTRAHTPAATAKFSQHRPTGHAVA